MKLHSLIALFATIFTAGCGGKTARCYSADGTLIYEAKIGVFVRGDREDGYRFREGGIFGDRVEAGADCIFIEN